MNGCPVCQSIDLDMPSGVVNAIERYYPNRTAIRTVDYTGTMFANYATVVIEVGCKDPGFTDTVELAVLTMSNDEREMIFYEIVRLPDNTFAVHDAGTARSYIDGGAFLPSDYLDDVYNKTNMPTGALLCFRRVFKEFFADYDIGNKHLLNHIAEQKRILSQYVPR